MSMVESGMAPAPTGRGAGVWGGCQVRQAGLERKQGNRARGSGDGREPAPAEDPVDHLPLRTAPGHTRTEPDSLLPSKRIGFAAVVRIELTHETSDARRGFRCFLDAADLAPVGPLRRRRSLMLGRVQTEGP